MFSFFSNKDITRNKKLVKKWSKEHQNLVEYATKVISSQNDKKPLKTKKYMGKLTDVALQHLMHEDIKFRELLDQATDNQVNVINSINEFRDTFCDAKKELFRFLTKYTKDDAVYDEHFDKSFGEIVGVLTQRIEYEEKNLYSLLNN